jgi:hypothetical protein
MLLLLLLLVPFYQFSGELRDARHSYQLPDIQRHSRIGADSD